MRRLCTEVSLSLCNKLTFVDKDADIERNFYDKIGRYWRDDICEAHNIPFAVNLAGSIGFILLLNFLASPKLAVGLILLMLGRKAGVTARITTRGGKVKSA